MTHLCVGNLTIIGPDNGLAPARRQAIIWTNAGILLIGPVETKFNAILSELVAFLFKKIRLNVMPFCLDLNMLKQKRFSVSVTDSICWHALDVKVLLFNLWYA